MIPHSPRLVTLMSAQPPGHAGHRFGRGRPGRPGRAHRVPGARARRDSRGPRRKWFHRGW